MQGIAGESLVPNTLCFIAEDGKYYSADHLLPPAPPAQQWDLTKKQLYSLIFEFTPRRVSVDLADTLYRITTLSEFKRFYAWSLIWTTKRKRNFKDCDALTRKLKGKLVEEGWAGLPPLDIWYKHANGGRHSEFGTVLVDDALWLANPEANVMSLAKAYLVEPGKPDMIRPCLEYFAPETGRSVYRINQ